MSPAAVRTVALLVALNAVSCTRARPPEESPRPPRDEDAGGTQDERAPALSLPSVNVDGGIVSAPPGAVTLVMFSASWHSPTKKYLPELEAIAERYASRNVRVAVVFVDEERAAVVDAARAWPIRAPLGWDADRTVARRWRMTHFPTVWIVDRAGIPRQRLDGLQGDDLPAIAEAASRL